MEEDTVDKKATRKDPYYVRTIIGIKPEKYVAKTNGARSYCGTRKENLFERINRTAALFLYDFSTPLVVSPLSSRKMYRMCDKCAREKASEAFEAFHKLERGKSIRKDTLLVNDSANPNRKGRAVPPRMQLFK